MTPAKSQAPAPALRRLAWHPLVWLACGLILVIAAVSFLVYRRVTIVTDLVADAETLRGTVRTETGGPAWLEEWLDDDTRERWFPVVTDVDMDRTEIDDAWLERLRFHPRMTGLSLRETRVRGSGFRIFESTREIATINVWGSDVGDEGWAHFPQLASLRRITAGYSGVTDAGLAHIRDMTQLEYVGLRGNDVTDEGVAHLEGLVELTGLYLGETRVTDRALEHLGRMSQLKMLNLEHTEITDAGLRHLEGLTALRSLSLGGTRVTAEGVLRLMQMLPEVVIDRSPSKKQDPRER